MDAPAVILCAVLGAAVGWFAIVAVVERIPEPCSLPTSVRVAIALVNGALWGLDANKFTRWWVVVCYVVVFSTLVAVSVVDLRLHRIPDRIVFPALAASVVLFTGAAIAIETDRIKFAVAGLATYFLILFVFHIAYPAGMGFGDVKLALLMGLSLGWLGDSAGSAAYLVTIALFYGCIVGIVFGLTVRFATHRRGEFPFGPALALATVFVVLNFQNYLV